MKEHKGLRLGFITAAAVAVALIGGLLIAQVSAASHALDVHDAKAIVGEAASVDVGAHDIVDPGLGSWTVDVSWDSSVVTLDSCDPAAIGGAFNDCNDAFDTDTLRIVGFVGDGLVGDTVLASLTFTCDVEGVSPLVVDLTTLVLKDGTAGDPGQIDATISDGSITCNVEEPTAEATALPTISPGETGTGPLAEGSNGVSAWLIAALAGAGFAALAGFGALRLRTRQ